MSVSKDIKEKLKVDPKNLNAELIEQPGLFAYYAYEMSKKKEELEELELDLDILESETDRKVRNNFLIKNEKVSEKKVEMVVMSITKVKELKRKIIKVNAEYNILKGIVRAYEQRKDVLVSLSANMREENKSDINLRDDK